MGIMEMSSEVVASDLVGERPETERRREQRAVSFARIGRGPKRQEANTRRLPRADRWTVEPLENGDKEADSAGQRQAPKPPRPIPTPFAVDRKSTRLNSSH